MDDRAHLVAYVSSYFEAVEARLSDGRWERWVVIGARSEATTDLRLGSFPPALGRLRLLYPSTLIHAIIG